MEQFKGGYCQVISSLDLWQTSKEVPILQQQKKFPKDLGKTRIENDEKFVQHCCGIIKSWQNPFEYNEKLVGLS